MFGVSDRWSLGAGSWRCVVCRHIVIIDAGSIAELIARANHLASFGSVIVNVRLNFSQIF